MALERNLIKKGQEFYRVEGRFAGISVVVHQSLTTSKKIIYRSKVYKKLADHIGKHPVILIGPDDIELINGHSKFRRRWMDIALCQMERTYLDALAKYMHILRQRNSYLKLHAVSKSTDVHLLDTYDLKLIPLGEQIYQYRKKFISELHHKASMVYKKLASPDAELTLSYKSDLSEASFDQLILQNRKRDIILQRSTVGIHRDDFTIGLQGVVAKMYASQGQKKTILFSIELALSQMLAVQTSKKAILLLDDVFDKLDPKRVKKLINAVTAGDFEQIFITDAHPLRLNQLMQDLNIRHNSITLAPTHQDEEAE